MEMREIVAPLVLANRHPILINQPSFWLDDAKQPGGAIKIEVSNLAVDPNGEKNTFQRIETQLKQKRC